MPSGLEFDVDAMRFCTLLEELDTSLIRGNDGGVQAALDKIQLIRPKKPKTPAYEPYLDAIPIDWLADAVRHYITYKGFRLEGLERALHTGKIVVTPQVDLKWDLLKVLDGQMPVKMKGVGIKLTIGF